MVRKRDLEQAIRRITAHPSPKTYLEQYTIPSEVAAEILYLAAYTYNDIIGKTVVDLGCGTGGLAIAAALLGAREAVGIEIDKIAIKEATKNAERLGVKTETDWIIGDIEAIRGNFDTVLQNPPFGVQRKRADRKFLEKALQIGRHVYSLHKAVTAIKEKGGFLSRFIQENGGEIKAIYTLKMSIPYMFHFHHKRKHTFAVNLYIIEKKDAQLKKEKVY
ncbi:MAG: METTL5 family protein [Candidatus Bathyarchaeales archaeon]